MKKFSDWNWLWIFRTLSVLCLVAVGWFILSVNGDLNSVLRWFRWLAIVSIAGLIFALLGLREALIKRQRRWLMATLVLVSMVPLAGYVLWQEARVVDDVDSVKIGVTVSRSCQNPGDPEKVINLAIEEINQAGGAQGRSLEPIYVDDGCADFGLTAAIKKLVLDEGVKIIIGAGCLSCHESLPPPVVDLLERNKVLMISGTATMPGLVAASPFFVRVIPSDADQGRVLGQAATSRGWRKVAILTTPHTYTAGVGNQFRANYRGEIVKEEYAAGVTDFRSQLLKLQVAKPDALFLNPLLQSEADKMVEQFDEMAWPVPLVINDVLEHRADLLTTHRVALEGALTAWHEVDQTNSKALTLEQNYLARYDEGTDLPQRDFRSFRLALYDAVYLLAEGLERFGQEPEKIAAWLRTIKNWDGASGLITVGSDGDRVGGFVLRLIENGRPTDEQSAGRPNPNSLN